MDNVTTAIIYYSVNDRIVYQKFAEFFRLAGIYVWEQCDVYRLDLKKTVEVKEICVGRGIPLIVSIRSLIAEAGEKENTWDYWCQLLDNFMSDNEISLAETELKEALLILKKIYNNDFFIATTTVQYYRMKDRLVLQAGDLFLQAIDQINMQLNEEPNLRKNRHIRYALLYCFQKANQARILCNEPIIEFADVLAERCLQLVMDYPDFSNAWALLGKIYEVSKGKTSEAIDAYEQAVKLQGDCPFVSSIYYWMGKRCEGYPNWDEVLQTAYVKAYHLEKNIEMFIKWQC